MAIGDTPTTSGHVKGPAPLPVEGFGSLDWWKTQITGAEEKIKRYAPAWKKNVSRQIGRPLETTPTTDTVIVPLDHANIEQKKAQLYFTNPDVQLTPAPGHEASADVLQAFSAVLNEYLGPDGVDAGALMEEGLTDVFVTGILFSVLGLDITQDGTKPVQVGERPVVQPGSILGLQPMMEPVYEEAPNIIHQAYFWSRVSPLMGLLPPRFHGSNFDRSPYLGYKFEMDKALAIRAYGLSEAEASQASETPDRLNDDEQMPTRDTDVVYGYCISYKGSLYNPAVKHPEEIWRLILIKGVDRVITHDRPYQQYAADGVTLLGMRGHFIGVYTPRYVSDSAIPPSDVSMSRQQVGELQKGRSQMILQRDRARPMRQVNISMVDPAQVEKLKRGEWQEIILTTSNEPIAIEIAQARMQRENFEFNKIINADIDRAWGFGDAQRGQAEDTKRTATELSMRASGSDTRMEKERNHLLAWYLKQCEKLAGLIQLFEDDRTTVQIAGETNTQRIVEWKKAELPVRFQCKANLDTMIRTDTAREDKRELDFYQMTVNDPHMNGVELLTNMARRRGYDTSKLIRPELPAKTPEPPKVAISVKGEDLNPAMPQFPLVMDMLAAGGITLNPENIKLGLALAQKAAMGVADPASVGAGPVAGVPGPNGAHGGPAEQAEPLSKRSGDQTGKLSGMGMAPAVN